MDRDVQPRNPNGSPYHSILPAADSETSAAASEAGNDTGGSNDPKRRKCVSTACIACRKRKSKCDGAHPACAACVSVYSTECVYDPASDHRRKGVYKKDIDNLKTRNSTLQTLIQAILNSTEDDLPDLVWKIRASENLDKVAEGIAAQENLVENEDIVEPYDKDPATWEDHPTFESRLSSKIGELRLDNGAVRMVGGTSNFMFLEEDNRTLESTPQLDQYQHPAEPITSWTTSTTDPDFVTHLLNHYFTWHYTFFTVLPKAAFYKHFNLGKPPVGTRRRTEFCTPLLVNAMLALGCHFTSNPAARKDPDDSATTGDHFFEEAKWLLYAEDELATPRLATVQALALMSVREAGCGREAKGWVYSGMAFRMACDLGLSFHSSLPVSNNGSSQAPDEEEEDARRITFWGCFMIDKCWSQYLGRLPIFQIDANITIPKFEVLPSEDSENWLPYSDSGFTKVNPQASRVRAVALQLSALCEISSDLMKYFYHPHHLDKPISKRQELKRLSEIHSRLEGWKRDLPKEFEPKEGVLSSVIVMHMLFQLLYIHLFRPFLKYNKDTSPLPSHVSPRKLCTQAAGSISKLMRLYKRSHGLRQVVNIVVYITHSACTIHLLNLPDKIAKRDVTHGFKHLEEVAEGWLCARRALRVLSVQARKWEIELPEQAAAVLARTDGKFGSPNASPSKTPADVLPHAERSKFDSNIVSPLEGRSVYLPEKTMSDPPVSGGMNPPQTSFFPMAPNLNYSQRGDFAAKRSRANIPLPLSIDPNAPRYRDPVDSQNSSPTQLFHNALSSPLSQSHDSVPEQRKLKRKPSDIFGGVEELLREGKDWWVNDQSQLASGFDNWNLGGAKQAQQQIPQQHFGNAHSSSSNLAALSRKQSLQGPVGGVQNQNAISSRPSGPDVFERKFSVPSVASVNQESTGNGAYDGLAESLNGSHDPGLTVPPGFPQDANDTYGLGAYTSVDETRWYD